MSDTILAIDQGTTNSKAILINQHGKIVAQGSASLDIDYPKPGWVEQSAVDIWDSVIAAIEQCLQSAPDARIAAIGLSNQRESVIAWNRTTGKPLCPAITWQCRRTSETTEQLRADGNNDWVLLKTGLPLDPLFPASKIRWLMDHCGDQDLCIGTVDSWLIWNLSDKQCFATDRSNAARTQLMNLDTGEWDSELCTLFGVDATVLPVICDSKHQFAVTKNMTTLPDNIPITSAIGDSHAALFGHAAFTTGEAKATFGTGSSVMMVSAEFCVPKDGMTTTVAWSIDGKMTYALEGNILVSASLFPWVATLLGLDGNVDKLMELATTVDNSDGAMLVPALVGLGAPHWNPTARGLITGLNFSTTPAHIAHAAALSLPLQAVDVFGAMYQQTPVTNGNIYVDGGPTKNPFLMQLLADLLNQPVHISKDPELSALGAGMLAGLQIGFWSDLDDIGRLERDRSTVHPAMDESTRNNVLSAWRNGIAQCLHQE